MKLLALHEYVQYMNAAKIAVLQMIEFRIETHFRSVKQRYITAGVLMISER